MKEKFTSNFSRSTLLKFDAYTLGKLYHIHFSLYTYVCVCRKIYSTVVYIFKLPLVSRINQFFQFHGARTYSTRSLRRLVTIWSYYSNARLFHLRWSIATIDLPGGFMATRAPFRRNFANSIPPLRAIAALSYFYCRVNSRASLSSHNCWLRCSVTFGLIEVEWYIGQCYDRGIRNDILHFVSVIVRENERLYRDWRVGQILFQYQRDVFCTRILHLHFNCI